MTDRYELIGLGLEGFRTLWCDNINCADCPLRHEGDGGACDPVNIGRIIAHHKVMTTAFGFNDDDAHKQIVDFESDKEHSEKEKCAFVGTLTSMARELGDILKDDE